jgi:hypothetical protein
MHKMDTWLMSGEVRLRSGQKVLLTNLASKLETNELYLCIPGLPDIIFLGKAYQNGKNDTK